jgi:hypothetical protein
MNDVDLHILCKLEDVPHYTQKLVAVLGEPKEATDKIATWDFMKDGFEIDCILSDPTISHVPKQRRCFDLLQNSPKLLEEYKQLKIKYDGLPYEEYAKVKKDFLEKISG